MTNPNWPRIYILAGDISYNRGDLASLHTQITEIRKLYPHAHITCCALSPEDCAGWVDAHIIKRSIFLNTQQIRHLRQADVIIWGGGAQLADHSCRLLVPYWAAVMFFIRYILRKRVIAVSHGVVLRTAIGKMLARFACQMVEVMAARDSRSMQTLKKLHLLTPLIQTADYAFLLTPDAQLDNKSRQLMEEGQGNVIAITLTFWHLYNSTRDMLPYIFRRRLGLYRLRDEQKMQQFKEGLARLASALIEKYDCHVRFISRYPNPLWDDIRHLEDVQAMSDHPERVLIYKKESISVTQYPTFLSQHRMVITMPFHDIILTLLAGTPFIALANEGKGMDLMQSLGGEGRYASWETLLRAEALPYILAMLESVQANWNSYRQSDQQMLDMLKLGAAGNTDIIREFLEKSAPAASV